MCKKASCSCLQSRLPGPSLPPMKKPRPHTFLPICSTANMLPSGSVYWPDTPAVKGLAYAHLLGGRQAAAGAMAADIVQGVQEGGWRLQDADDLLIGTAGILSASRGCRGQVAHTAEVMSMYLCRTKLFLLENQIRSCS